MPRAKGPDSFEARPAPPITLAEFRGRVALLEPRERSLARLVVAGALNKQIASELDVSLRTTDRLRAEVLQSLHARSVVELARWFGFSEAAELIAAAIGQALAVGDTAGNSMGRLKASLAMLQSGDLPLPPLTRPELQRPGAEPCGPTGAEETSPAGPGPPPAEIDPPTSNGLDRLPIRRVDAAVVPPSVLGASTVWACAFQPLEAIQTAH